MFETICKIACISPVRIVIRRGGGWSDDWNQITSVEKSKVRKWDFKVFPREDNHKTKKS